MASIASGTAAGNFNKIPFLGLIISQILLLAAIISARLGNALTCKAFAGLINAIGVKIKS